MTAFLLSTTYLTRPKASLARIVYDGAVARVRVLLDKLALIKRRFSNPRRVFPFMRAEPVGQFRLCEPDGLVWASDYTPVRPYWWWDPREEPWSLDPLDRLLMEGA